MKHAYMIMAHSQVELLQLLLKNLDHEDNNIIVHIDAKSDINPMILQKTVQKSNLFFADRILVRWGGYSQILAEISLLSKAREIGKHSYYHLLTGVDLPIRPISEVNRFYEENNGKEFLNYSDKRECLHQYEIRMKYKHYFRDKCGRDKNIYTIVNKILIYLQRIRKLKPELLKDEFYCGSAYWDITEGLADYILSKTDEIERKYKYSSCCDEVFVHELVWNSHYKNKLFCPFLGNGYKGNMRWIDMERGQNAGPHIINLDDIVNIRESGMLFARKFDWNRYRNVIYMICKYNEVNS